MRVDGWGGGEGAFGVCGTWRLWHLRQLARAALGACSAWRLRRLEPAALGDCGAWRLVVPGAIVCLSWPVEACRGLQRLPETQMSPNQDFRMFPERYHRD